MTERCQLIERPCARQPRARVRRQHLAPGAKRSSDMLTPPANGKGRSRSALPVCSTATEQMRARSLSALPREVLTPSPSCSSSLLLPCMLPESPLEGSSRTEPGQESEAIRQPDQDRSLGNRSGPVRLSDARGSQFQCPKRQLKDASASGSVRHARWGAGSEQLRPPEAAPAGGRGHSTRNCHTSQPQEPTLNAQCPPCRLAATVF